MTPELQSQRSLSSYHQKLPSPQQIFIYFLAVKLLGHNFMGFLIPAGCSIPKLNNVLIKEIAFDFKGSLCSNCMLQELRNGFALLLPQLNHTWCCSP